MTTLHAFDKSSGESKTWVAVPLEMIDWMADHCGGKFATYLARLDPYADIKIADDELNHATNELVAVLTKLRTESCAVPEVVDLFGPYGITKAKRTVVEMIEFFQGVSENNWKVVSIGD